MQKNFSQVNIWASWPAVFNDEDFMKKAVVIMEENVDDFGDYITEKTEIFSLNDPAIVC